MWSIEETKRLKWQNELGWSVTESAEVLERSELDIRNKLISMGLKPIEDDEKPVKTKARKKRQTINPDIKAKIIKLRSQGYDYKYIGEQTNTSKATIARILQQSGNTNAEHKKAGNNGLAEKYAELEKHVKSVEEIDEKRRIELKRTAENLTTANLEIQMLQNKIKVLEAERSEKTTEPADNWSIRELKNVLEPLKAIRTENGLDVLWKTIGQTKLENVALYIKNLKADAAMYKAEKQAFAERQAAAERKVESLTEWLKNALNGQKFKTEKAEVSFRKTSKVEVLDIWELNEDFVKYSDPTPDKAAIKRAIKAGEEVKGAKLVDDIIMTIK